MRQTREALPLEGLILHLQNYGESDRIVEILARGHGKISLLARGARASKRRFAGALDLFIGLRAEVIPRGTLWVLSAADVLSPRVGIRGSWEAIERASVLTDCVRALVPEHHESDEVLSVAELGLDVLAAGEISQAAAAFPRLLEAAGLLPDLSRCALCGRDTQQLSRSPVPGGLACHVCRPKVAPLSDAAHRVLVGGHCDDPATAQEVETVCAELVEALVGRRLRTRTVR